MRSESSLVRGEISPLDPEILTIMLSLTRAARITPSRFNVMPLTTPMSPSTLVEPLARSNRFSLPSAMTMIRSLSGDQEAPFGFSVPGSTWGVSPPIGRIHAAILPSAVGALYRSVRPFGERRGDEVPESSSRICGSV